jgi:hypothetical protein
VWVFFLALHLLSPFMCKICAILRVWQRAGLRSLVRVKACRSTKLMQGVTASSHLVVKRIIAPRSIFHSHLGNFRHVLRGDPTATSISNLKLSSKHRSRSPMHYTIYLAPPGLIGLPLDSCSMLKVGRARLFSTFDELNLLAWSGSTSSFFHLQYFHSSNLRSSDTFHFS